MSSSRPGSRPTSSRSSRRTHPLDPGHRNDLYGRRVVQFGAVGPARPAADDDAQDPSDGCRRLLLRLGLGERGVQGVAGAAEDARAARTSDTQGPPAGGGAGAGQGGDEGTPTDGTYDDYETGGADSADGGDDVLDPTDPDASADEDDESIASTKDADAAPDAATTGAGSTGTAAPAKPATLIGRCRHGHGLTRPTAASPNGDRRMTDFPILPLTDDLAGHLRRSSTRTTRRRPTVPSRPEEHRRHGVDPAFELAMFLHESSYGRKEPPSRGATGEPAPLTVLQELQGFRSTRPGLRVPATPPACFASTA
jgi:hypothetical protein